MKLTLFDEAFRDIGDLYLDIDFEIGDSESLNDFELSYSDRLSGAYGLYVPGTEWGGVFEYQKGRTTSNTVTLKGWTWRGLLTQSIIIPPPGEDYKTVSGEANTILRELLEGVLDGFFDVPDKDSGLTIESYQFALYVITLEGITDMLAQYGYRLKIYTTKEPGESLRVCCEAVPIMVLEGEYNEDNDLDMIFVNNQMGINHLICMGSGELQERQRLDLYLQKDGSIGTEAYYTGFLERAELYDYPNAKNLEDLKQSGITRLKEIASRKTLEIEEVNLEEMEVGDVVTGRHRMLGITLQSPIVRKVLKIKDGIPSMEHEVKGEG